MSAVPASSLAGVLALVLLIAGVLTALVTAALLRQYGRAIREMTHQRIAGDDESPTPIPIAMPAPDEAGADLNALGAEAPGAISPVARPIFERALWGPWLTALVYGTAGLGYALLVTLCWFLNSAHVMAFPLSTRLVTGALVVWIY